VLKRARTEGIELARIVRDMPYQVHDLLEEARDGQIEVGFVHKGVDDFMRKLDAALNRLVVALIVVGGLIGSSLIGIFSTKGPQLAGVNFLSFIGFVLSAILGLWLLWGVIRSGRL
jgi:ubiquinone biosynthesis protein